MMMLMSQAEVATKRTWQSMMALTAETQRLQLPVDIAERRMSSHRQASTTHTAVYNRASSAVALLRRVLVGHCTMAVGKMLSSSLIFCFAVCS